MKRYILRFLGVCVFLLGFAQVVRADDPPPSIFDGLTATIADASTFFGVITVLAILVTGFFLGRSWLRRVG